MLTFFSHYHVWGMWFLQFAIGVIFIVHGIPKLKQTSKALQIGGSIHGLIEVVGGIALWFSYHVRAVGLAFTIIMLGAIFFKMFKWKIPFKAHDNTGWEFDFILLAVSLFLLTH